MYSQSGRLPMPVQRDAIRPRRSIVANAGIVSSPNRLARSPKRSLIDGHFHSYRATNSRAGSSSTDRTNPTKATFG